MNTTELIEIARECCFSRQVVGDETVLITFRSEQLQQFAQRIEQPLLDRINRLVDKLNAKDTQIEQLREALNDALRYKRADEKLVDIINGVGQQQQKPKHGRQA